MKLKRKPLKPTKMCNKCGIEKNRSDFYSYFSRGNERQVAYCKDCSVAYNKAHRINWLPKDNIYGDGTGNLRKEYSVWRQMKNRCSNPKNAGYKRYGGRGIKVCDRWQEFKNFWQDMGPRPTEKHTIERVDNDGNYEPTNCKWATQKEQRRNYSRNVVLEVDGVSKLLMDWAISLGTTGAYIQYRIKKLGWSVKDAVTTPPVHKKRKK